MILQGKDLIVLSDGVAVALSKSCTVDVKAETKEVALHGAGNYNYYVAGRRTWQVQTGHLVAAARDFALTVGGTYTLTVKVSGSDTDTLSGTAICTAARITATKGSLVQGTFTWQGSGALQ